MATKKQPELIPGPLWKQRRVRLLSCTECGREVPVMAHEDPQAGDGWPMHRCPAVRQVRPFNRSDVL